MDNPGLPLANLTPQQLAFLSQLILPQGLQSQPSSLQAPAPGIVYKKNLWHPDFLANASSAYRPDCLQRVQRDLRELLAEEQPGADIFPSEEDASLVEILLRGQRETPYEGGFFHFSLRAPPDYPRVPPRVAIRTTGGGVVRFNPNFYENGCVCLSLLGTYPGEPWSAQYRLANVLHALQYQLNSLPYDNEPGFDQDYPDCFKRLYNDYISHETLRAAVCDQLDSTMSQLPAQLRRRAARHFVGSYEDVYASRCEALSQRLDGKPMMNPYRMQERATAFDFASLRRRLSSLFDGDARRDAELAADDQE